MNAEAPTHNLSLARLPSPLGDLLLVVDAAATLLALEWADHEARLQRLLTRHWGVGGHAPELGPAEAPSRLRDALSQYFAGDCQALDTLPVRTAGTPFQQQVWHALRHIAPGKTLSYGQLAVQLRKPAAVRAVGLAVGANPVSLVVPCHRVIGADGSLTGYAGGLERKRALLRLEGAVFNDRTASTPPR